MVIRTHFELESLRDQLALIKSLGSHINLDEHVYKEDVDPDLEKLLKKMDTSVRNLNEKYEELKKLLDN